MSIEQILSEDLLTTKSKNRKRKVFNDDNNRGGESGYQQNNENNVATKRQKKNTYYASLQKQKQQRNHNNNINSHANTFRNKHSKNNTKKLEKRLTKFINSRNHNDHNNININNSSSHGQNGKHKLAVSWDKIGLCKELLIAVKKQSWKIPTSIQIESIPQILLGKDVIALAETGSGKTAAFALPILQSLLNRPISYHSLVLCPTRELALQINTEFNNLGAGIGLKSLTIIGGINKVLQQLKLQKKPHLIVGTPGRILDHLINCKGFQLNPLKFLVLDEADRILQTEFAIAVEQIIKLIQKSKIEEHHRRKLQLRQNVSGLISNPGHHHNADEFDGHDYQTLLYSATMTKRVERLEKACLKEPIVKIQVSKKYKTVANLSQFYLFIPAKHKLCYITYLLMNVFNNRSIIVFTNTKKSCHHLSLVLHNLSVTIIPLHGEMTQYERMGAIEKFRDGEKSILIATDVAARGLDIPLVTVIINYDLPIHSKDYIHRVGRTARAGKKGEALNLVTQYDVEIFQRIEQLIGGIRMATYPSISSEQVMLMIERVMQAERVAQMQMKEHKSEIKSKIKELNLKKNGYRKKINNSRNNSLNNKFVIDDIDHDADEEQSQSRNHKFKNYRNKNRRYNGNRNNNKSFKSVKDFRKTWKY